MSATEPRYCPISTLHRTLRQGTGSKEPARATDTRRLRIIAGFYKYTVEEGTPRALTRRARPHERGALLVAAGLPTEHAPISLLAERAAGLRGMRIIQAKRYCCKEHLGLDVLISLPKPPPR